MKKNKLEMDHNTIRERNMLSYRTPRYLYEGPEEKYMEWLKSEYYDGVDEMMEKIYELDYNNLNLIDKVKEVDIDFYVFTYYIPHPAIRLACVTLYKSIEGYKDRRSKNMRIEKDEKFLSDELLFKYEILIMILYYEFYKKEQYPLDIHIYVQAKDGKIKFERTFPTEKIDHYFRCEVDEKEAIFKMENNRGETFEKKIVKLSDIGEVAEWCVKNIYAKNEYFDPPSK